MFFDTNIIIGYMSEGFDENISKILLDHIEENQAYLSGIVMAEVLAYQGYDERQAKDVESFLKNSFLIFSVDDSVLLLSSKIARKHKQETAKKLKLTDAIIAATSILNKRELLTLDKDDFKRVQDLKLYIKKL
jgi:predicted nucleic acid-binding protein